VEAVDSAIAALNVPTRQSSATTQYASLKNTEVFEAAPNPSLAFSPTPWTDQAAIPEQAALVPPAADARPGDIRASVSSLAQAIGTFDSIAAAKRTNEGVPADNPRGPGQGATAATLTVASMVDVMKRFDSNGNTLISTGQAATSLGKTLNLPGVADSVKNGVLASGGG
jgi:hypothetical protein